MKRINTANFFYVTRKNETPAIKAPAPVLDREKADTVYQAKLNEVTAKIAELDAKIATIDAELATVTKIRATQNLQCERRKAANWIQTLRRELERTREVFGL